VPPLRDHREDVPVLARHFLAGFAATYRVPVPTLAPDAAQRLASYEWPGNVRELRNVCERLTIRAQGRRIEMDDLPHEVIHGPHPKLERRAATKGRADELFDRMVAGKMPFWTAVHEPFLDRDLTRDDLRALITRGLETTRGSYTHLTALFNIERRDYKKFLNFLHKHGCHVPVARYRHGHGEDIRDRAADRPMAGVSNRGD
jgi:DNA-binding NtrC family response regulator